MPEGAGRLDQTAVGLEFRAGGQKQKIHCAMVPQG